MNRPLFIGICGGSASGKTQLANRIVDELNEEEVAMLSLDSYYLNAEDFPAGIRGNYDHPESIDQSLLVRQLSELKSGKCIDLPDYDFLTHSRIGSHRFEPRRVVIIEGLLLLCIRDACAQMDATVFVEASTAVRLARRIHRDVRERGRTEQSVRQQFNTTVQPMHDQFVEPFRHRATIAVSGEDAPEEIFRKTLAALAVAGYPIG